MAIKGIKVILIKKTKVGEDDFNEPIYSITEIEVDNVLVSPSSTDDIVNAQDIYGKKAVYTLAIPKGDQNDWKDTIVKFFNQTWHTFGIPIEGIDENIPLSWNKKVMVERYE